MSNSQDNQFGNPNNNNPVQDNTNNNNNNNNYNNNGNPYNNFNNQNWQNNNAWNNNNNNSSNSDSAKLLKRAKTNASCYIAFLILAFVLIVAGVVLLNVSYVALEAAERSYDVGVVNGAISLSYLTIAVLVIGIIFAVATFICGIITIVFSSSLKNKYHEDFETIFLISSIGIVVPILTFVASCLIISKYKKLSSSSDNNGYVNRSSSNPY